MSAASAIPCPHCNQQIGTDPGLAGRQVSCPHCQKIFAMPLAAPATPFPAAQAVGGFPQVPAGPVFGGLRCPYCGNQGPPLIRKGGLSGTGWVLFVVLVFFSCFLLCWLPFVIDSCKEDVRICANCGSKLG